MEYGINVDTLKAIVERESKETKELKNPKETEKYTSKIVEYTFFVQNEIEISEKLNEFNTTYHQNSAYHFLTIKKYDFIKICESNKQILEKMNIDIDLNKNANNKKFVLLKYKKDIGNSLNNDKMSSFIDSIFYHNHLNNTSIFSDKPRASFIFWEFLTTYEGFFNDFLYLANKDILFLDFSSKNLVYDNKHTVFFKQFDKCLIRKDFDISKKDLFTHGDFQKLPKYIEIETYIDKFIKIIDSIDYYGNKHFDLYFSKQIIKAKNFSTVYQNLDIIIDDYLNNLQILKNFSDKFKNDNKNKWKALIKSIIEDNINYFNMDVTKLNWKLYLLMLLERYHPTVWETFSLNSLFLNITYYMIKTFDVKDKASLIHRYFKFLYKNIDINCSSFNIFKNSNNNINMDTCMRNYDNFRYSFEHDKDFTSDQYFSLSHVTVEIQEELYEFLSQNCIIENF
jgi:hypothetical protein